MVSVSPWGIATFAIWSTSTTPDFPRIIELEPTDLTVTRNFPAAAPDVVGVGVGAISTEAEATDSKEPGIIDDTVIERPDVPAATPEFVTSNTAMS